MNYEHLFILKGLNMNGVGGGFGVFRIANLHNSIHYTLETRFQFLYYDIEEK